VPLGILVDRAKVRRWPGAFGGSHASSKYKEK